MLPNLEEEMQMGKAELSAKREEEAECAENVGALSYYASWHFQLLSLSAIS